jgi:tRNA-Thr(GGU) m(6)t(6)A37 methyltransferase TsaA
MAQFQPTAREFRVAARRTILAATLLLVPAFTMAESDSTPDAQAGQAGARPSYRLSPIGWVRKTDGRTTIELYDEYRPGLLGVDELDSIWVLYWFDRNDSPQRRAVLQVHPRANPDNPLRGVFATRAPLRPNLIALSRCRVLGVQGSVIEIDDIDAFANTPVLDIKP